MEKPIFYYFGKWKEENGHSLYDQNGSIIFSKNNNLPDELQPKKLDICPLGKQSEVFLNHTKGFTIISFKDNSGDLRPNSHSKFIAQ